MLTKEEVLAKAKELGLTLTDAEVDQFVKDGKLPEKVENKTGTRIEELIAKYSQRQLAEMYLETSGEAKDRRIKARDLETQMGEIKKELETKGELLSKYPELEKQLKGLETQLQAQKDAEKKRREAKYNSLDEKKKNAFKVLLDVDRVGADDFDAQMEIISGHKSDGHSSESSGGLPGPVALTDAQKKEASDMHLEPAAYLEVMGKRKKQ
jgi:hypothetical protein